VKARILSTIALWAVLLGILTVFGADGGAWLLTIAALLTQHEIYNLTEREDAHPARFTGYLAGVWIILGEYYLRHTALFQPIDIVIIGILFLGFTVCALDLRRGRFGGLIPTIFGFFYAPFLLSFFVQLEGLPHIFATSDPVNATAQGLFLAVWVGATTKFNDAGALLFGLLLGKHKLVPKLSPGKTIEGAIGGLLTSMAVGAGILLITQNLQPAWVPNQFTMMHALPFALLLAISAVFADLLGSALKRTAHKKDSGKVIPGIGGMLDLTDSLILAGPMGYLLFKVFVYHG